GRDAIGQRRFAIKSAVTSRRAQRERDERLTTQARAVTAVPRALAAAAVLPVKAKKQREFARMPEAPTSPAYAPPPETQPQQ
ncbi:MAG TPA: hypothetical protein VJZ00_24310, partial [Thermoanaerobaculia bacterium]|nr:hypothetical protein [Thermoanaerobaculia bacterium]